MGRPDRQPAAFFRHHGSRACVMLPLAGSWEETRAGLKRNIKESLRRSRNRIAKDGRSWVIHRRGSDLDVSVVDRFLALHRKRAAQQVAVEHGDAFADPDGANCCEDYCPLWVGAAARRSTSSSWPAWPWPAS